MSKITSAAELLGCTVVIAGLITFGVATGATYLVLPPVNRAANPAKFWVVQGMAALTALIMTVWAIGPLLGPSPQ